MSGPHKRDDLNYIQPLLLGSAELGPGIMSVPLSAVLTFIGFLKHCATTKRIMLPTLVMIIASSIAHFLQGSVGGSIKSVAVVK